MIWNPIFLLLISIFCFRFSLADEFIITIPEIKVNPVSGEISGKDRIFPSIFTSPYNLLESGDIITLRVFPQERVCFQIVAPRDSSMTITLMNATPVEITLYQLGMVRPDRDEDRIYPDVLLPMTERSRPTIFRRVQDENLITERCRYDLFWIELDFPIASEHPEYQFSLHFSGKRIQKTVEFKVSVLDVSLPHVDFNLDLNDYGAKYLRVFGGDVSDSVLAAFEEKVFRLAADHGSSLNLLPYKSQRGTPHPGFAPTLANSDLLHPELDWDDFDVRFGKYFDGSAFPDGKPIDHFYLPFNPDWPAPFDLFLNDRTRYETIWKAFASEFIRHFAERGWTETQFQVYCNQKPRDNNKIPWNLDEPKSLEDYRALRYFCDLTHRVFKNEQNVEVKFRIDISHFYCDEHRGNTEKDFRLNRGGEILAPVDIWVIQNHSLEDEPALQRAQELRGNQKQVWMYGDTPRIQQAGSQAFLPIYYGWYHGLNGYIVWKTFTRELNRGGGNDFVIYILKDSQNRPAIFPSLRLKLFRRALDDIRIFHWAIQQHYLDNQNVFSIIPMYQENNLRAIWDWRLATYGKTFIPE